MGHFHKKEPTGKTLLQRKAQWAGLSKKCLNFSIERIYNKVKYITQLCTSQMYNDLNLQIENQIHPVVSYSQNIQHTALELDAQTNGRTWCNRQTDRPTYTHAHGRTCSNVVRSVERNTIFNQVYCIKEDGFQLHLNPWLFPLNIIQNYLS